MNRLRFALLGALCLLLVAPASASAFCGFYVTGSDAELTNDATQVALMRYGTKTVVSMQNNYDGPPEDFAMVVPVPQVLREKNVRTLPTEVFATIDRLSAPRLVEYWEQDPCPDYGAYDRDDVSMAKPTQEGGVSLRLFKKKKPKVKVEAEFSVGEYDIVILSATESTALETWLNQNDYKIPEGASPYLQPYVESGMYFFVARVDIEKVQRNADGRAVLSPIRFHYDNDDFFLPVRLGMINAQGKQDLVVYALGYERRFEVANRPNIFIPTNIEVHDAVRNDFPGFYEGVFAAAMQEHPGAVVTEYAWGTSKCDPCPGPTLSEEDLLTLGMDIMPKSIQGRLGWVVSRLHARYAPDEIGEDLVFAAAPPMVGGREVRDADGALEKGATQARQNTFQGRYIIRHEWTGDATCDDPRFGVWGGPPGGGSAGVHGAPSANTRGEAPPQSVSVDLAQLIKEPLGDLTVRPARDVELPGPSKGTPSMCAGCSTTEAAGNGGLVLLVLMLVRLRRRR